MYNSLPPSRNMTMASGVTSATSSSLSRDYLDDRSNRDPSQRSPAIKDYIWDLSPFIEHQFLFQGSPDIAAKPDFATAEAEAEWWEAWPRYYFESEDAPVRRDTAPDTLYANLSFNDSDNENDGSNPADCVRWTNPRHEHVSYLHPTLPDGASTSMSASPTLMEDKSASSRSPSPSRCSATPERVLDGGIAKDFKGSAQGSVQVSAAQSIASSVKGLVPLTVESPVARFVAPSVQGSVEGSFRPQFVVQSPGGSVAGFAEEFVESSSNEITRPEQTSHWLRRSRRVIPKPSTYNFSHDDDHDDDSDLDPLSDMDTPPHHTRAGPSRRMTPAPIRPSARPKSVRVHKPKTTKGAPAVKPPKRKEVYILNADIARRVRDEHSRLQDDLPEYLIQTPIDTGVPGDTRYRCAHQSEDGTPCTKATNRLEQAKRHALTHHGKLRWLCGNPNCGQLFARIDPTKRHMSQTSCKNSLPPGTTETIIIVVDDVRIVNGVHRVYAAHPVTPVYP